MEGITLEDYINELYTLLEEEDVIAPTNEPIEEPNKEPEKVTPDLKQQTPAEIDTLTREQLRYVLQNSKGKIITVVFKKKNGTTRIMNTRTGVVKNIKGVGLPYDPEEYGYFILWDLKKGNYRTINSSTVSTLKSAGKTYAITEAIDWRPVNFKNGIIVYQGEMAWKQWRKWADFNRRDNFIYKVLESIKNQQYLASPKQQEVLNKWFNSKR